MIKLDYPLFRIFNVHEMKMSELPQKLDPFLSQPEPVVIVMRLVSIFIYPKTHRRSRAEGQ